MLVRNIGIYFLQIFTAYQLFICSKETIEATTLLHLKLDCFGVGVRFVANSYVYYFVLLKFGLTCSATVSFVLFWFILPRRHILVHFPLFILFNLCLCHWISIYIECIISISYFYSNMQRTFFSYLIRSITKLNEFY